MASDPTPPADSFPYVAPPPPPPTGGEPGGQASPPVAPSPYAQYPSASYPPGAHPPGAYPPGAYPPAASPYGPYPPAPTTNVLAIVGFVASFFVGLAGIICGHIALSQIRRTGEKGRGLALAATIIGYVQVALWFLWIAAVILIAVAGGVAHTVAAEASASPSAPNSDCITLESAAQSLSNSLTNLEASDWRNAPGDAKAKVVEAWTRFEDQTSSIADQTMSDGINTEDDNLSALSTALVDYEAAAPGQGDQAAVTTALTKASDGLRTLTSTCG
ncbi:DUF4190 domain-containing protein [Leifsonia shinshuensis]